MSNICVIVRERGEVGPVTERERAMLSHGFYTIPEWIELYCEQVVGETYAHDCISTFEELCREEARAARIETSIERAVADDETSGDGYVFPMDEDIEIGSPSRTLWIPPQE